MSSFDDEFGLFGETTVDEGERVATPRRDVAPPPRRDVAPPPRRESAPAPRRERPVSQAVEKRPPRRTERQHSSPQDPWAGHRRATELLGFLARKLVQKPDSVAVELFIDERQQPVIELIVDPEDLGKVIGRSGRVAHALRTIVRATAEGRVSVDILDSEEASGEPEDDAGE